MDFLKKNYEKVLLGFVLAGLIGVLIFMLFYITADKQAMAEHSTGLLYPSVKELTNLDLTVQSNTVARQQSPYNLDFETGNKVFNPGEWQRSLDGSLIPTATKTGLKVAEVTGITPLYLIISLQSVITNELGARYVIGVEDQGASSVAKRRKRSHYASKGDKPNDTFELVEVKGPAESPGALVLKLVDSGELVSITRDTPYRRVDGYAADFSYAPEKKTFRARRIGDKVAFGGVEYLVVEVNQNELILSDQSNQKKTPLPYSP